jgi:2'-5' RNA ligase
VTAAPLPYPDADELVDHWWWRPGWQIGTRFYAWHLTLDDQPALRQLAAAYQAALRDVPTLDPIPERWLHITTQGVGHTRDVPADQLAAIIDAVRSRLSKVPIPVVTFHRAVLHREAVVIPPTEPEPLRALRHAIRAGIADVWGSDRVPDVAAGWRPHVSVTYVNGPTSAQPVRALLDTAQTAPVEVTIRQTSLIEMHRDNRMYEWTNRAVSRLTSVL